MKSADSDRESGLKIELKLFTVECQTQKANYIDCCYGLVLDWSHRVRIQVWALPAQDEILKCITGS